MTSSRAKLGVIVTLACAVLLSACTSGNPGRPVQPTPPPPRQTLPNFVFVLTDDLSTNLLPYLPNVAALTRQGTSFSNYFVVDSLCCPSRSAIFTGQYPHNNGVFTNGGSDGGYRTYNAHHDAAKSFAASLHAAGYRTGFMGKYLNGYTPGNRQPIGWDEWDVAGNGYGEFDYQLNENGRIHGYGHKPGDYLTDVLAAKATRFIDGAAAGQRPFALEIATFAPHAPAVAAPRHQNTFAGLRAPHTGAYDRRPSAAPRWLAALPRLTAGEQHAIDGDFAKRVRSMQAVDEMVGRLRSQLQARGLAGNTYFVFSSDNGFHLGEHRLRPGKQTAFDTDIRVPLVVSGPGVASGRTVRAMTSSIDLAPTFEALAGARAVAERDGTSIVPLLHSQSPPDWRDAVLVEHHGPVTSSTDPDRQPVRAGRPPSYEAMRTPTALYVEYVTGEREYYDLVHDPDELHNRAGTLPAARLAFLHRTLQALVSCRGSAACRTAADSA
jgi:arylsulfatase A-like enzyme